MKTSKTKKPSIPRESGSARVTPSYVAELVAAKATVESHMLEARRSLDELMLDHEQHRADDSRRHFVAALRAMHQAEDRVRDVVSEAFTPRD